MKDTDNISPFPVGKSLGRQAVKYFNEAMEKARTPEEKDAVKIELVKFYLRVNLLSQVVSAGFDPKEFLVIPEIDA